MRIIPPSRAGRAIATVATVSLTAGVALIAVGLGGTPRPDGPATQASGSAPVAVARATDGGTAGGDGSGRTTYASGVELAGYDPAAGTAVLNRRTGGDDAPADIRTGDVIASPPTEAAPHGALFTVGDVTPTATGVKVTTEPATLSDALGATEVSKTAEAPDLDVSVTPLAAGVAPAASVDDLPEAVRESTSDTTGPDGPADAGPPAGNDTPAETATPTQTATPTETEPTADSTTAASGGPAPDADATANPPATPTPSGPAADGAAGRFGVPGVSIAGNPILSPTRTADGGLLLALNIPLDGVPGITGTGQTAPVLAGWVGFTPKLVFSYGRKNVDGARPYQAEIGVGGSYQYGWNVNVALDGPSDTGERALQLPFAEVNLNHTFWIGPIPVVLSVKLTYFYRLTADGDLSIVTAQSTTGEFAVGAKYDSRSGWGPLNRHEATTEANGVPVVTGRGDFRATVGADLTVLLYDAAGVRGRLAPYLRSTIDATDAPPVRWGVYAGFALTGALTIHLKIFGITLLRADIAFPPVSAEWRVASSDPAPTAPGGPADG